MSGGISTKDSSTLDGDIWPLDDGYLGPPKGDRIDRGRYTDITPYTRVGLEPYAH